MCEVQSSYASAGVIKISDLLCVLKSGEKADKLTSGCGVIIDLRSATLLDYLSLQRH